ncbi:hypothetical protein BLNAU_18899 [Blattamonas nauphoetae]|uniref:Uncharacterized protein n=1 Tax=Blattamonas nauphoetae TaxID=2049346 RepID=A0ABQ9X387_9EUKA|nr:hypothetical protein BLNAU_18899 [Blattamonas nauphoetae]
MPSSLEISNDSPLDSRSIPATTDILTITPNEHQYIRISKQILQYEMKLKRINIDTISEPTPLKDGAITLTTSITSDWRLVLQDSITSSDLQKGCISLFNRIDTDLPLSETEMNHAVRFLEYATFHNQYRRDPHCKVLETILSQEVYFIASRSFALLKLVCHPTNTLQMAALSFLDASISKSLPNDLYFAAAVTRLLPLLLERLKPHEIPLNRTTIEFHRHLISNLDRFFSEFSPEGLYHDCITLPSSPLAIGFTSAGLSSISNPSLAYLRSLLAAPVCSPGTLSGVMHLSTMRQFREIMHFRHSNARYPEIQRFFGEIRMKIVKEFASLLGFPSTIEAAFCLPYDHADPKTTEHWLKGFKYLLKRVSEGTQFSDLGTLAVAILLSNCPSKLKLFFFSDDKFGLKNEDTIVSSSPLDTKALWKLFTPTQPHHAAIILDAFRRFMNHEDSLPFEKHIWSGWFPSFIKAVDPSKLPFTADIIPFHKQLIEMMSDHLAKILKYEEQSARPWTDQLRGELDETYRAFYTHTKEYVVHLSLHPFALNNIHSDKILYFLGREYLFDLEDSLNKPYREDAKKAMDASALSSSSPPFILTSQLVCSLPHDEMLNVVDRIVALLKSDSCLDDDTILRICAFHKHKLQYVQLPDLFRKAGRSPEQYLHAFECLLSLPIDCFDLAPINNLLTTRWVKEPTLDEWDDVDFERVGIVKRLISQNHLPVTNDSNAFITIIVEYIVPRLPHIHHCAARLCQSQLDRLLAPSVDFLCHFIIHQSNLSCQERGKRKKQFVGVCKLCDQHVIAQCLARTGFFSRFVTGLFDDDCSGTVSCFKTIINCESSPDISIEDVIAIQRRISNLVEEGLQDASEFLFVKRHFTPYTTRDIASKMMKFCGANFKGLRG